MGIGQVVGSLVKAAPKIVQEAKVLAPEVGALVKSVEEAAGWGPKAGQAAKAVGQAATELAGEMKVATPDRVKTLFQAGVAKLSGESSDVKSLVQSLKAGRSDTAVETFAKMSVADKEAVRAAAPELSQYLGGNAKLAQSASKAAEFVAQHKPADLARLGTMSEAELKSMHSSLSTAFGTLKNHQSQVSIPGEFREAAVSAARSAKEGLAGVEHSLKGDLEATKAAMARAAEASKAAQTAAQNASPLEKAAARATELANKGFRDFKQAEVEFPQLSMRRVGITQLEKDATGAVKNTKVTLEQLYSNAENLGVQVMNTFDFSAGQAIKKWADTFGKKTFTPESMKQFHLALQADLKAAEASVNGKPERQAVLDALRNISQYTGKLEESAKRSGLSSLAKTSQEVLAF